MTTCTVCQNWTRRPLPGAACGQSRLFCHLHPVGVAAFGAHGLLSGDVSVNAITGSTGAGVKPGATTHFSWRNNNMSIYKAFNHQHVPEICQSLRALQPDFGGAIDFIPYRGDFARGIFATEVVRVDASADAGYFAGLYKEYYKDAPSRITWTRPST